MYETCEGLYLWGWKPLQGPFLFHLGWHEAMHQCPEFKQFLYEIESRCLSLVSMHWCTKKNFHFSHLHVGSPHMDQISPQHLSVFLVEGDPCPNHLPGKDLLRFLTNRICTSWQGCQIVGDPDSKQLLQRLNTEPNPKSTPTDVQPLVQTPLLDQTHSSQWAEGTSSLQRAPWISIKHNHRHLLKSVIVDCLPRHWEVLPARQGVLLLVITHPSFASALVEIVVWLVDIYSKSAEDAKIFSLKAVLLINWITDVSMVSMAGAFARVAVREYLKSPC